MTSAKIPTPESVLGYRMGTARRLPDWGEIVNYFETLAAASDRVALERLGESTDGRPYIAVTVSSPENLARRDELRSMLERLHDPRDLPAEEAARLVEDGRVTAFLLCTQHSNEIGAALMTLELAAELASKDDPETGEILDNVVTVMIPTHNPDG
ncbi:MAG TPA: M14 family zinc carboxypeptidase, partial [Thermomicrobiales bacterium]|nr:M14 family zinc carboxypeptidase [Thermomicrobiales bacterium]